MTLNRVKNRSQPSHTQSWSLALGMVVVGLLAGCEAAPGARDALLFFPAPPEKPRVQFLTWASGADQIEPQQGTFESFILGDEPVIERAINKPYGIAVRDGVAYVCDTKGLRLCRLDFKEQRYSVMGTQGPGRLRKPINVVIDSMGYKFVVDSIRKQVVIFSDVDKYVTAFDVPEPCHPVDLSIHGNEIYVLDNDETCQIVVMDRKDGRVLRTLGEPGGGPGQFKIPNSLCVDSAGNIYVSDTHNWRLQKLDPEGKSIWIKGTPGYTLGRFGRPRGIRVASDGVVYVVDGATEIVQLFNPEGETLMRFAGPGDVPGALGLPSSLAIDTTSIPYFDQYVHEDFQVQYLLFVVSQYGKHLVSVYAFGAFPEGYQLSQSQIATLPEALSEEGIGPAKSSTPPSGPLESNAASENDAPG